MPKAGYSVADPDTHAHLSDVLPHEFAARYGDTDAREHLFRRLLVGGEFGADQRCRAGHARPNAALAVAGTALISL